MDKTKFFERLFFISFVLLAIGFIMLLKTLSNA